MTILDQMEARLAELRQIMTDSYDQRGALIDAVAIEKRGFNDDEQARYDALSATRAQAEREIAPVTERVAELRAAAERTAASDEVRATTGETGIPARVTDPIVYAKGNREMSFFRDLARQKTTGDPEAGDRLRRHQRQMADAPEFRALGNTNTTGGSGGELAPPAWWTQDWIPLVRPGRVIANLYKSQAVPPGVSSVNLPKVATGTTVALQSTQNTALSQTDLTTTSVSTGFSAIGGKQVVSQNLIDQSAIDFDMFIMQDLAAAWAQNFATQIISGAGTGANNNSVVNGLVNAAIPAANQSTFTSASPTAALFYSKAAGMLSAFASARYAEPTVWVFHPRRWYWLLAQVDSQGRPLVVPNDVAYNPMAENDNPAGVAGSVGRFLGLPVVIDPLLPTNLGAGTNQDTVFLLKQDDLWLFESPIQAEAFREPYADSLGVLFRCFSYVGTILNRQTASLASMNGTGLVAPTF